MNPTVSEAVDQFEGITWETDDLHGVRAVAGPRLGQAGIEAQDEAVTLRFTPEASTLNPRGHISFWVRLDQPYQSGQHADDSIRQRIVSFPGVFHVDFEQHTHMLALFWRWASPNGVYPMRTFLPGLPGPAWCHLAYEWDADAGLFQGYINGTPQRLAGTRIAPWQMTEPTELVLHLDRFAISNLRVSDEPLNKEALPRELTPLYHRSLDLLLGARPLGSSAIEQRKGRLLYERALAKPDDVADWVMEGPAELNFEDGWMSMASKRPDGPEGHIVHWCDVDFPDSYIVEWEIQPISEDGLCIVFFSACGREGQDLFDGSLEKREGVFTRYHSGDIDCYHISYYANTPNEPGRITSNMRKNHGFYLVANGPPGIAPGSQAVHRVQLMKDGGRVQMAVDGQRIIDFHDDGQTYGPVLGGGKIGLRQMQWMAARYRNFRVYGLTADGENLAPFSDPQREQQKQPSRKEEH